MGLGIGLSKVSCNNCKCVKPETNTTPEPNPLSFDIKEIYQGKKYDLVKVYYNNCTTFNRNSFV